MENNTLNPGHTVGGGYPFEKNEAKDFMSVIYKDDEPIEIQLEGYKEAFDMAIGQIDDMLKEDPFMPQSFGFELAHKNKDITEPPVSIYVSRFNDKYTLFRKPGLSPYDPKFNPSLWTLMEKKEDGTFKEVELNLVNHRIAYATLYALGIPVKANFIDDVIADAIEAVKKDNEDIETKMWSKSPLDSRDSKTNNLLLKMRTHTIR